MKNILLRSLVAAALSAGLLLACGGKTAGDGSNGSSSGGGSSGGSSSGASSGGASSGSASSSGGSGCVYVDLSTYDTSCSQASDCAPVTSGEICGGQCNCPQDAINSSDLGRYEQATSGIQASTCFCPGEPLPQCIDDRCTIGGSTTIDASVPGDSGLCVDIDLTTYDQTCNVDGDCISITAGVVCSGQCACGGSVINVDGEARYEAAVSGVDPEACPCVENGVPRCVTGECVLCGFGPGQPAGCGDGG